MKLATKADKKENFGKMTVRVLDFFFVITAKVVARGKGRWFQPCDRPRKPHAKLAPKAGKKEIIGKKGVRVQNFFLVAMAPRA